MTDEEFQRIKEAEKERLRARKRMKAALDQTSRSRSIQSAVARMAKGARSVLQRASDTLDRLLEETARSEAKLEVALDEAGETSSTAPLDDPLEDDRLAEEDRKARADAFVRQMKQAQGQAPSAGRRATSKRDADDATDAPDDDSDDDLPDKTIGRMSSSD